VVAFAPEILHIYGWPLHKGPRLAQGVYASQTVAQAEQCIKVVQIGGVAALARIEGKIKTLITAQGFALVVGQWRYHRNLQCMECLGELVFLEYLGAGPA